MKLLVSKSAASTLLALMIVGPSPLTMKGEIVDDPRHGRIWNLRAGFREHWTAYDTFPKKWTDITKHLRPSHTGDTLRIEEDLGQRIEDAYILLPQPTPADDLNATKVVLLERVAKKDSISGKPVRYAIAFTDDRKFNDVILAAHHTDDLVEEAIAAGGENKPLPPNATEETPRPPIASIPPAEDRAGRYLKFLLWLAVLAIVAVIGVTIGRSSYERKDRQ